MGVAAGCGMSATPAVQEPSEAVAQESGLPEISWQMATSWPVALDTIFGGAQVFAERVSAMTGGRFKIEPRGRRTGPRHPGAGRGLLKARCRLGTRRPTTTWARARRRPFGTTLPFGLNAQQQNSWLYEGGGLDLMQEFYREKFNVIQFPAGNTGVQMGGWFNKEVNTAADLQGLKMRIPGLGGQVMAKLGVNVQVLPGGEIFQALQTGAIDAAEWVGPYDDEILGLNKVTSYYYAPGWWEPGPTLEVEINLDEWNKLPQIYQEIVKTAAFEANMTMLARYDARNNDALQRLLESGVELREYSPEIMQAAEAASFELYDEFSASDADFKSIFEQWSAFREGIYAWHDVNEGSFSRYVWGI
ncbi:MAG: TRAP transporter substrate-binding protein DctP [Caldilineaceae bacterium]